MSILPSALGVNLSEMTVVPPGPVISARIVTSTLMFVTVNFSWFVCPKNCPFVGEVTFKVWLYPRVVPRNRATAPIHAFHFAFLITFAYLFGVRGSYCRRFERIESTKEATPPSSLDSTILSATALQSSLALLTAAETPAYSSMGTSLE